MEKNKYKTRFTPKASNDLEEIYSYIVSELYSMASANNLMNKIETSIMRLVDFPLSCSFVDDETLKEKGYRKLIIDKYIAFFIVDEMQKAGGYHACALRKTQISR